MADAQSILTPLSIPKSVKADAFDAYQGAKSVDDLATRLQKLPLPQKVRADLWDAKNAELSASTPQMFSDGDSYHEPMSLGGFGANVLSSGANLLGNLGTAIAHPIDTATNVARTVIGGVQKLERPLIVATGAVPADMPPTEDEQAFDQFANNLKQRYGSIDKVIQTAYHDPVGLAADVSAIAGGASGALRGAASAADAAGAANLANTARAVAATAGKVADVTNPVALIGKPVAAGLDAAGGSTASHLYQSALKPSKANSLEDINQMVQTGLNEGINPGNVQSLAKVRGLLSDVRNTIQQGIDARAKQGATIDPNAVATRVDDMRGRFQTVDPSRDLAAIDATKQRFLDQFTPAAKPAPQPSGLLGPNGKPLPTPAPAAAPTPQPIPLDQAQAMKMNTNAILSPKMGELSTAATEAQKALVRGLKEEIEGVFPEIASLNARQSALMGLEPAVEGALKRIGSKDLIPIGDSVRATLAKVMDNPSVKAKIAIGLQNAPQLSKGVTNGARFAIVSDRIQQYLNGIGAAEAADQRQ